MKAAEAAFVLIILAAIVVGLVLAIRTVYRYWRANRHPAWHMVEEADGELVSVFAESGEERLLIGAAPFASDSFDDQLYTLRAEGREKVYVLNEGRR